MKQIKQIDFDTAIPSDFVPQYELLDKPFEPVENRLKALAEIEAKMSGPTVDWLKKNMAVRLIPHLEDKKHIVKAHVRKILRNQFNINKQLSDFDDIIPLLGEAPGLGMPVVPGNINNSTDAKVEKLKKGLSIEQTLESQKETLEIILEETRKNTMRPGHRLDLVLASSRLLLEGWGAGVAEKAEQVITANVRTPEEWLTFLPYVVDFSKSYEHEKETYIPAVVNVLKNQKNQMLHKKTYKESGILISENEIKIQPDLIIAKPYM